MKIPPPASYANDNLGYPIDRTGQVPIGPGRYGGDSDERPTWLRKTFTDIPALRIVRDYLGDAVLERIFECMSKLVLVRYGIDVHDPYGLDPNVLFVAIEVARREVLKDVGTPEALSLIRSDR